MNHTLLVLRHATPDERGRDGSQYQQLRRQAHRHRRLRPRGASHAPRTTPSVRTTPNKNGREPENNNRERELALTYSGALL
jgi:hypothetical protein